MRTILVNLLDSTVDAVDAAAGPRGRSAAIDRALRHTLDLPPEEHVRRARDSRTPRCEVVTRDGSVCDRRGAVKVGGRYVCTRHYHRPLCPSCGEPSRGGAICKACHLSDDRASVPTVAQGEELTPRTTGTPSAVPPSPCGDHVPCETCINREDCKPDLW